MTYQVLNAYSEERSMTQYTILQHPDEGLKRKGVIVEDFGDNFQTIIDNMFETHYGTSNCAALAATQLSIPNAPHVTVIDYSPKHDQPLCLVNAKIVDMRGETFEDEACMSVADIAEPVKRAEWIRVESVDRFGKEQNFEAEGFLGKCVQHELDHLKGIIFIDYLSKLKRQRVEKRMAKMRKLQRL
jgi:peptide deformylase